MEKSLKYNLRYKDYEAAARSFDLQYCEVIARLANISLPLNGKKEPGRALIDELDLLGFTVEQYKELCRKAKNIKIINTYYKPLAKMAILIGNDRYLNLSKLSTPSLDCDSLANNLKKLNFIVATLKNCLSKDVKVILERIFRIVPEKSYCFIYYAGHGCELNNTKYMLDVQCPIENITTEHCITENYVLKEVAKCKPDLCVFIMDMCRYNLDSVSNPELYSLISSETFEMENINNLFITYTTQRSQSAYECVDIEVDDPISMSKTYERQPGDSDRIKPRASQYVLALCSRLFDNLDVSSLLDKVHGDVENSKKTQRPQKPIKVQSGVAKRSLYDPVAGDTVELKRKLQEIESDFKGLLEFYDGVDNSTTNGDTNLSSTGQVH